MDIVGERERVCGAVTVVIVVNRRTVIVLLRPLYTAVQSDMQAVSHNALHRPCIQLVLILNYTHGNIIAVIIYSSPVHIIN